MSHCDRQVITDPAAIFDTFATGVRLQRVAGGISRFVFVQQQEDGLATEQVVAARIVVTPECLFDLGCLVRQAMPRAA